MRTRLMAIGLAAVVAVVPASFAQDSRVPDQGKSAGTGIEAAEPQTHRQFGNDTGISLAVPIGRVSVGPASLEGEPVFVRRTKGKEGMTIVDVSTTPFMPLANEEASGAHGSIGRPDQPAGW